MTQSSNGFASSKIIQKLKQSVKQFLPPRTPQERAARQFFAVQLNPGDVTIDCGANVGKFTQHLAQSGSTVYAFEPNPYAFKVLERQFSSSENVYCFLKGVDDTNGFTKLFLHEKSDQDEVYWSTGSSLIELKENVRTDKFVEVEIIDLCEFISKIPQRIRLLKMDVEGVECRILKKMINADVVRKIDYIFVETHDHKIPELKPLMDEIRGLIREKGLENVNLDWT